MTYSIIKKSQLEGAFRLDAEYYQPEYLEIKDKLVSCNSKSLNEFLQLLYRYPTFYNLQYYNDGILVLKGEDILPEGFIQNQSHDYISEEDAKRFSKTILKEGDIAFSVRGYVGKAGIVDNKYKGSIISANLIRMVIENVSPYYIWIFFNSKYGVNQINRVKMITAQETIVADDIKNFLIPEFSKKKQGEIEGLAKQAIKKYREAESINTQAEDSLLKELGIKDFKFENDLAYSTTLKDCQQSGRIDAEYFQPKYEKIKNNILKKACANLGEIFSIKRGDFISPDYYVERAKRGYIRIKELPLKGEININQVSYIDNNFKEKHQGTLKENDFVFACIGATLGKTGRIPKQLDGAFYSNNTARFRLNETWERKINIYYLQILLQSLICQMQFEQRQAQTAQAKITDDDLRKVIIPILPLKTQQKIAKMVEESFKLRQEAKKLLEEAKRKVEEEIEGE